MNHFRMHGKPPYQTILIHGGPGAIGEMEPLAKELSKSMGIIEPFQTKMSIPELVAELNEIIEQHHNEPVHVVGFSWGAWLGSIFTASHPDKVKKLILVGSGPFEESYAAGIMETRFNRMSEEDKKAFKMLEQKLFEQDADKDNILMQLGHLICKADSFDPIFMNQEEERMEVNFDHYSRIWKEASVLRKSGELLELTKTIKCPIAILHGDYDPHPYAGVIEPLSKTAASLKFTIFDRCGHKPWIERYARDEFIKLLIEELAVESRSPFDLNS